jgi:hypothetical protein
MISNIHTAEAEAGSTLVRLRESNNRTRGEITAMTGLPTNDYFAAAAAVETVVPVPFAGIGHRRIPAVVGTATATTLTAAPNPANQFSEVPRYRRQVYSRQANKDVLSLYVSRLDYFRFALRSGGVSAIISVRPPRSRVLAKKLPACPSSDSNARIGPVHTSTIAVM